MSSFIGCGSWLAYAVSVIRSDRCFSVNSWQMVPQLCGNLRSRTWKHPGCEESRLCPVAMSSAAQLQVRSYRGLIPPDYMLCRLRAPAWLCRQSSRCICVGGSAFYGQALRLWDRSCVTAPCSAAWGEFALSRLNGASSSKHGEEPSLSGPDNAIVSCSQCFARGGSCDRSRYREVCIPGRAGQAPFSASLCPSRVRDVGLHIARMGRHGRQLVSSFQQPTR